MRINIVTKRGWILERMARELEAIPGVTINASSQERKTDSRADLHYYMPAKDILKYPSPGGPAVGLFTHGEPLPEILHQLNACIAMNHSMGTLLHEVAKVPVEVICPGTEAPSRPPVFGVVGRAYRSGRKGQELVRLAVEDGFNFVACTPAEHIRATLNTLWGCKVTHTTADRSAFYRSIDYLVVPSLEEGGPIPVLEAVAHHVPVIAPDVGFCWEFPVIRYDRGSYESLRRVLLRLAHPPTWETWVHAHRGFFSRLIGKQIEGAA